KRMPRVESLIERRRRNASFYAERLAGLVAVPIEREGEFDVYYTFTIRSSRRDELKAFLDGRGIETKIQHPLLMPDQPAYRDQVRGEFANAGRLVREVLCIPIHEKLVRADLDYVAECISEFGTSLPSWPR